MITFLSNDRLGPRVNWSTLSPPVAAGLEDTGAARVVRPEPDLARRPRTWWATARAVRSDTHFWIQTSARPESLISAVSLLAPRARRSAFAFDAWPYAIPRIGQAARWQRLDPLFVAFREGYDQLAAQFPGGRFVHLPFGADTRVFKPHRADKDVFVFWMGRRHAPLHAALQTYCDARGLDYVFSDGGGIADPRELAAMIARSRYFVVTTPDVDHPDRAGGFSPLVMRYLEGLACGTRLLGTLPRSGEYEAMLPLDALLQVRPDGSDLAARLDADVAAGGHRDAVAAACEQVHREHSWARRAAQIVDHLAAAA